jgi:hypothetical protein
MLTIPNNLFFSLVESAIASGESVDIRVRGWSMLPTLVDNRHRVVLVPYDRVHLRVGAIALIRYGGRHVLHRLVARRNGKMIFRGDNLPRTVERVAECDIVALVRRIIGPDGREIDCRGWRFIVTGHLIALTGRPRSIFLSRWAALRVRLGRKKHRV